MILLFLQSHLGVTMTETGRTLMRSLWNISEHVALLRRCGLISRRTTIFEVHSLRGLVEDIRIRFYDTRIIETMNRLHMEI